MEARRGPSRPASRRASARIQCKNRGFLHDSLTWRPEGTRDFIILNKSHQGPPWTFGRRGSHVAEEPSRILILCSSQVTWLSVSGEGSERAAAWWATPRMAGGSGLGERGMYMIMLTLCAHVFCGIIIHVLRKNTSVRRELETNWPVGF